MSSGTIAKPEPLVVSPPVAVEAASEADRFIQERLRQTRRQMRWVDVAAGVLGIVVGALAYLLPGTLLDHWVVAGGLGPIGRWALWSILVVTAGAVIVRRVAPPLRFRVNPVFAAYTLERSRPAAKNSLINYLLLRGRRQEVAPVVYAALEHRAADELRHIEIEAAVERRHVFWLGYALVAVLAVFCAYQVLSPKSAIASALRILWPWADIPAPTRVTIDNVVPGSTVAFHGDSVTVTAEVRGLRADEAVTLLYGTADGQIVDQAVPMERPQGDYRFRAVLPPRRAGLQQDHVYRIAAGDCATPAYRVEVQVAPSIAVESIEYEYPPYTGLGRATVPRQGDIRAIEGTTIRLRAAANRPIRRAEIDLGCDGRHLLSMQCDERRATGRFVLGLAERDPPKPEYDAYQLLFTDRSGHSNPRPIRYAIEVIADLAPLVEWVEPRQSEVAIAEDGRLDLVVKARDPDFALRRVAVHFQAEQGDSPEPVALLDRPAPSEAQPGELVGTFRFEPIALGVKAGQRVACWVEAADNKLPEPNRTLSERRWIRILSPEQTEPATTGEPGRPSGEGQDASAGATSEPTEAAGQPLPPEQPGAAEPSAPLQPDRPRAAEPPQPDAGSPNDEAAGGQGALGAGSRQGQTGDAAARHDGNDPSADGAPAARDEEPRGGQSKGDPPQPINPRTNPGDAFERILEHLRRSEQRQQDQLAQRDDPRQSTQPPSSPPPPSTESPGSRPSQEPQPPKPQPPEQPSPETPQPSGGQSSDQQAGGQQGGSEPNAGRQSGGQASGAQPSGAQPGGAEPDGQQQSGGQPGSPTASGQPGGARQDGGRSSDSQPSTAEPPASRPAAPGQPSAGVSGGPPPASDAASGRQPDGQSSENSSAGGQPSGSRPSPGQTPAGGEQTTGQESTAQASEDQPSAAGQPGGRPSTGQRPNPATERGSPDQSPPGTERPEPRPPGAAPPGNPPDDARQPSPGQRPHAAEQPAEGGRPQQPSAPGEPAEPRGGGGEPNPSQGSGGAGQRSESPEAGTAPQEANRERPKRPGESGAGASSQQSSQPAQSPTTSPHESDSSSDTSGDRSGGGEQGGGQHANQPGIGAPGTQTDAVSGGSQSQTPGDGETGSRAGDRDPGGRPSGGPTVPREGGRSGQGATSSGQTALPERPSNAADTPGVPIERPTDGGTAGQRVSKGPGARGDAEPTSGGAPGDQPLADGADAGGQPGGSEANLEYARRQTELALEHLKDQIARQQPELLEQLGWTRQQAEQFLREWEEMKRRAARGDANAEAARRELDDALRSLGLRPRGAQLGGGRAGSDRVEGVGQSGRIEPPADWAEWLRAYTKGIAESNR